jgi:hypothetical protein
VETEELYELVYEATRAALVDTQGELPWLARRMENGRVMFEDGQGKIVKEIDVSTVFRKITSVREKLRVLEQKLNNHGGLSDGDKAELQVYISRCYGSLTTFNFLFDDTRDSFKGTGR